MASVGIDGLRTRIINFNSLHERHTKTRTHSHSHRLYSIAAETKQRRIITKWEKEKKDCFETKLRTYESHYYRPSWINANANANTNNNKNNYKFFISSLRSWLYSLRLLVPLLYVLHTTVICVLHFSLFHSLHFVVAVSSSSSSSSRFFASPKR